MPVQVIHGSFEGLIGVYLTNSGKHRVIVKVEALNSFIEITLPLSHIEKI
jgi:transcription antitermination factor NusG